MKWALEPIEIFVAERKLFAFSWVMQIAHVKLHSAFFFEKQILLAY